MHSVPTSSQTGFTSTQVNPCDLSSLTHSESQRTPLGCSARDLLQKGYLSNMHKILDEIMSRSFFMECLARPAESMTSGTLKIKVKAHKQAATEGGVLRIEAQHLIRSRMHGFPLKY